MKNVFGLILLLGCGTAFAEGLPPSQLPGLPQSQLPKSCNCVNGDKCRCGDNCSCADGIGCKKTAANQEVAFVGEDPFQTTSTTVEADQPTAPQGYHVEYRKVCNGSSCQLVPTRVANTAAPVASSCATGNCSTGSCATTGSESGGSCGFMSRGPVRRIFGRLRGRCG